MLNEIAKVFDVYKVGGCVRDKLLGFEPHDIDYCVVATEVKFELLFPSLKRVGNSFPVYLNPKCGSEIALTRHEHNVGNKYQDFEYRSGVSIEEDLLRRDFTINSIAEYCATGIIIDPFNGADDIENGVIRCVNEKAFAEDPLRILRGLRFACRFNFVINDFTLGLMTLEVDKLRHIKPERIELELRKVYEQSANPSKFFYLLHSIGGLTHFFPEFIKAATIPAGPQEHHPEGSVLNHLMISFDNAKLSNCSFEVAISALLHDLGKIATPAEILPKHIGHEDKIEVLERFLARHRFSSNLKKLAKLVFVNHMRFHVIEKLKPGKVIKFVKSIPKHLRCDFIAVCNCDSLLTEDMLKIFDNGCRAIDSAVIEIPEHLNGCCEYIKEYVLCKTIEFYKTL